MPDPLDGSQPRGFLEYHSLTWNKWAREAARQIGVWV